MLQEKPLISLREKLQKQLRNILHTFYKLLNFADDIALFLLMSEPKCIFMSGRPDFSNRGSGFIKEFYGFLGDQQN